MGASREFMIMAECSGISEDFNTVIPHESGDVEICAADEWSVLLTKKKKTDSQDELSSR